MEDRMLYPRILGNYEPDYLVLAASQRTQQIHNSRPTYQPLIDISEEPSQELPSILRIFNHYFHEVQSRDDNSASAPFIYNVTALHDVEFSAKYPVLGMGHNFAVWAAPFDPSDEGYKAIDGRAINPQVYCLKTPNFTSGGNRDDSGEFRTEYYDTTLQEIRVLLHPHLRRCENIISIFGLDFQEDYNDYTLAWPVLLMEYAEYGTLDTLQEDVYVGVDLSRILLLDVARGIQALHDCNIVHGDVKSENVLICRHHLRKYIARLSDFGLSLINPDISRSDHRLPGETFLWSAPECGQIMPVGSLKQTDVYSFGLMAWRVFRNHPNPYRLIPPEHLGIVGPGELRDIVTFAKGHQDFQQLVLNTMTTQTNTPYFFHLIVNSTLGRDPSSRSLEQTTFLLSQGQDSALSCFKDSETYWVMEQPFLVLENLQEAYPEKLLQCTLKPAMLLSIADALKIVLETRSELASDAGWLLFNLSSDQQFRVLICDEEQCCQMLVQLCELNSTKARAMAAKYHVISAKWPQALTIRWLEDAASNGSYYAIECLRLMDPDKFQRLISRPLNFEFASTDAEVVESEILQSCRLGDYEACKRILCSNSPLPEQSSGVSPYHWLVSFQNETQIEDLVGTLLHRGAPLGLWEGENDEFVFGRVVGTPMCWAVWHRNIPLLRVLLRNFSEIEVEVMDRLINLAAGMHFYDVLEAVKVSAVCICNGSKPNWQKALYCAGDISEFKLARRLRHGDDKMRQALERTFDILLSIYKPTKDDIKVLFNFAFYKTSPDLLRYLLDNMDLAKRKDLVQNPAVDLVLCTVATGQKELFEIFISRGLINPSTEHGVQKWKPLQVCAFSRQRDPYFAKRLVEIGCPVDGTGTIKNTIWTPFATAVCSGRYEVATTLLELGANKDAQFGWLGGTSVTMNLLQSWPDIPVSRLKYLLEEVPRLGFGHVNFWGWPGAGGNILYSLAMSHWPSYTNGNRLEETAKYILSQLADKNSLNKIDKLGQTALRMACACGNYEICRVLIEAGHDVNLSAGVTPLYGALEWRNECIKTEREAFANKDGPGRVGRQAQTLRIRSEMTVDLLKTHGAVERGLKDGINITRAWLSSGQLQMPSYETIFELLSGAIDSRGLVNPGSTPLHPTSKGDFRPHHGNKTWIQERLASIGKRIDDRNPAVEIITPRYQQHSCLPWRNCGCFSSPRPVYQQPTQMSVEAQLPYQIQSQPLQPQTLALLIQEIKNHLLLHFLEGGGDALSIPDRKIHAIKMLREQLCAPIILERECLDLEVESCDEFEELKKTVEICLDFMGIEGCVSLVLELGDRGKGLIGVHVFEN